MVSKNDPEKHRETERSKDLLGSYPDAGTDSGATFGGDLDILAEHLAKLEKAISGYASDAGPGTVRIDPSDIFELGRQIGLRIRAELDTDTTNVPQPPVNNATEHAGPSKHPSIIKEHWMHQEERSSKGRQTEFQLDGTEDAERGLVAAHMCRDAIVRLRKHEEQTAKRIAGLTEYVEQEEGRRLALRADLDREKAELQGWHDRELRLILESMFKGAGDLFKASREGGQEPVRNSDVKGDLLKLESERKNRLQSARAKAYALHAAGKYEEAVQAYQDYFDLLGDGLADIPALHSSRECAGQAKRAARRVRRTWALASLFVGLFALWSGCIMYISGRTVVGARLAAGNGDIDALDVYCNRLESSLFRMGSLGAVDYLYGPEIERWGSQVREPEQGVHAMFASADSSETDEGSTMVATGIADGPVATGIDAEAFELCSNDDAVVTNVLVPPILSFALTPRDAEAFIYNGDFEKMETEHSVTMLEPGGRYLLLGSKRGHELYAKPIIADWEGIRRMDISLVHSRFAGTASGQRKRSADISMDELFQLMEEYEKRLIRKRWYELGGGYLD